MLESFLAQEEGKTLEFKENAGSMQRILQTLVAFANTAGGVLIIGIKDKSKEVVGVGDVLKEEERIANAIADNIAPLLVPNFQFCTWRNRDVLIISVTYAPVPYYLKSKEIERGVYVRLGSTNRVADQATIAEIRRLAIHQGFDESPNFQAVENDLDFKCGEELFLQVNKRFDLSVVKSLHLLVRHQAAYYPSNGGLLLFGKNRHHFFPNSIIHCGCFFGTTKNQILDQQDIDEMLPLAINKILSFIERNTSKKSEIGRIRRIDIPQYPELVVREAVINAIVHANYAVRGANIQIAIFSDRLEITSPGALPYGLTLEKALSGISQLRNRVVGHVFRELGLIERWGSGLGRMIEECRKQGIDEPKFEELDHYFRVTLYHNKQREIESSVQWQQILIKYLKENIDINTKAAAILWGVTGRTASVRLKQMVNHGFIVEVATGPYDPKKKFILSK